MGYAPGVGVGLPGNSQPTKGKPHEAYPTTRSFIPLPIRLFDRMVRFQGYDNVAVLLGCPHPGLSVGCTRRALNREANHAP